MAAITCVAFLNAFWGKFVLDDISEIERNPAIRQLLPPWQAMFVGNRLPARPLPYLTFAIDHSIWGGRPFGYHLTNLVVHVIAALAVFDLTRLTLLSPRLRSRWGDRAVPLSMLIAMVWAVHPLQTQAVTYVYQRIESMAGMFCLLSLATYARAAATGWPTGLLCGSAAAAAAAMASKENAVVLPFLILAYDWFFVANGPERWPRSLWYRRWYFGLLASTWLILAAQLLVLGGKYQEFEDQKHSPLHYALTQPGVILHYLRLAVWPVGQQFDYSNWPVATSVRQVLPALTIVLVSLAANAIGTLYRRPWAWLGVLFFLALAPTSSIMPIEAVANEHRMYVALAAAAAAAVLGAVTLAEWIATRRPGGIRHDPRLPSAVAAVVILLLVLTTQFRNQLYSKVGGIWLDVLAKAPDNYRANWMAASIFDSAGETEIGIQFAERSIANNPMSHVFSDLAQFHSMHGDHAGAERICRRALELQRSHFGPEDKSVLWTTADLANALDRQGKSDEAVAMCATSIGAMRRVLGDGDPATISARRILSESAVRRGDGAGEAGSSAAPPRTP